MAEVLIAHPIPVDGVPCEPGDTITTDLGTANRLRSAGYGVILSDDSPEEPTMPESLVEAVRSIVAGMPDVVHVVNDADDPLADDEGRVLVRVDRADDTVTAPLYVAPPGL